jgi:hypothetical protein
MAALAGDNVTEATGVKLIVTVALPLTPSTVAVIVAAPGINAVTSPLVALTLATSELLDDHVVGRPVITLPPASRAVAVSVS